jgi:hypothetical protein
MEREINEICGDTHEWEINIYRSRGCYYSSL